MEAARANRLRDLLRSMWDSMLSSRNNARPTYTFKDPHRCVHCQSIIVGCAVLNEDSDDRWSGRSPWPDPASLVLLDYDLEEAFNAAHKGCALYVWVLENLLEDTAHETSFPETIISEHHQFSLYFSGSRTITLWFEWGKDRMQKLAYRHISRIPLHRCAEERKYIGNIRRA